MILKPSTEAVTLRCSVKNGVLKIFAEFTRKRFCQSLFLRKLQASGLHFYWKRESPAQVFPYEFCKILRTSFCRTPPMAASASKHEIFI